MNFFELSTDNLNEVEKLLASNDIALKNYFLNPQEDRYKMFGYVDRTLQSVVGVVDSVAVPAWILSRSFSYGYIENQLFLLKNIITIKEQQSLYQFFTLIDDIEFQFFQTKLHRYQPYLEHVIPPNSLTGHESTDHDVMEYKTYDSPLKIFNWVLKNEYRVIAK